MFSSLLEAALYFSRLPSTALNFAVGAEGVQKRPEPVSLLEVLGGQRVALRTEEKGEGRVQMAGWPGHPASVALWPLMTRVRSRRSRLEAMRAGAPGALAARQLRVTAQLRGSAFDAFNIRTSELFFILRRKVRVSQPGQIAQGKFHFPFVGASAFMCWAVHCSYLAGSRLAGPRSRQPIWGLAGEGASSSALEAFRGARSRGATGGLKLPLQYARHWWTDPGGFPPRPVQPVWPPFPTRTALFVPLLLGACFPCKEGNEGHARGRQPAPSSTARGGCSRVSGVQVQLCCLLAPQP